MFCSVNYAWRVVRGRCIYKGRIGGEGVIYARSAATARYLGALRGDSASLEPSHRRDEQEVPEAQARRGVEEGVVGAGLGLPAVDAVLRHTVGDDRAGRGRDAIKNPAGRHDGNEGIGPEELHTCVEIN